MVWRILKKDMKRRKSVNIILFLFITLASVFLSSSTNNILVVTSALSYYLDYANIPDVTIIANGASEKEDIEDWIAQEAPGVTDWGYGTMISVLDQNIKINGSDELWDSGGTTVYLSQIHEKYLKIFNEKGENFSLQSGQIAMTQGTMDHNHLKPGDRITVTAGNTEKEFTVECSIKDAAFGNEMAGVSRLVLSQEDYEAFAGDTACQVMNIYFTETEKVSDFQKEYNLQAFSTTMNCIGRDLFELAYSFDMILSALLILIGICLILIALLVLRFTLVFTIEEEYREIGIMKAMGLKGFAIKKLYLIKYFALVTAGAFLGLVISLPVGHAMIAGVSKNMIMEDVSSNIWVNIICTLLIIVCVMAFCLNCTRKLNKVSVITAIRNGQTGERYNRRAGIRLHSRKNMRVTIFLGINDILSHIKRYLVLIVTFCISFLLITIPLNTLNTMRSSEMYSKFMLDPESAVFLGSIEGTNGTGFQNTKDLEKALERVKQELAEEGYEAELTAVSLHFKSYRSWDGIQQSNILTAYIDGYNTDFATFSKGKAPLLSNEIAFSEKLMEESGWSIGDTVETTINGQTKEFLITGSYSDYMQMGISARLNPEIDLSQESMMNCWTISVNMDTAKSQEELAEELREKFPDYEWSTAQQIVDQNVGNIQQSLQKMLIPMTGMLCAVIMLITLLMEQLFIVREKGEIAMMKSIGFKNREIRMWQVLRMVWVALVSMVVAVPLSFVSNRFVLRPLFAIMGANVTIQVAPVQVYVIYPGVLLMGIIAAAAAATGKVKKINIRELNHLE